MRNVIQLIFLLICVSCYKPIDENPVVFYADLNANDNTHQAMIQKDVEQDYELIVSLNNEPLTYQSELHNKTVSIRFNAQLNPGDDVSIRLIQEDLVAEATQTVPFPLSILETRKIDAFNFRILTSGITQDGHYLVRGNIPFILTDNISNQQESFTHLIQNNVKGDSLTPLNLKFRSSSDLPLDALITLQSTTKSTVDAFKVDHYGSRSLTVEFLPTDYIKNGVGYFSIVQPTIVRISS